MQKGISYVLRFGVITCALVIAAGIFLGWLWPQSSHGLSSETLRLLTSGNTVSQVSIPRSFESFSEGIKTLDAGTVIGLGLLMLIALPILRVAFTFVLFVLEGDLFYCGVTLFVLAVLVGSLFLGRAL